MNHTPHPQLQTRFSPVEMGRGLKPGSLSGAGPLVAVGCGGGRRFRLTSCIAMGYVCSVIVNHHPKIRRPSPPHVGYHTGRVDLLPRRSQQWQSVN